MATSRVIEGFAMTWNRRASGIAAATIVAIVAVSVWGGLPGAGASGKLLTPIIKYHETRYKRNRDRWQNDLDRAKKSMGHTLSGFDRLRRTLDNASSPPEQSRPAQADASRQLTLETRGFVGSIGQVEDILWDASLHENMTL